MRRDYKTIPRRAAVGGKSCVFRSKLELRWATVLELCKQFDQLGEAVLGHPVLDWLYEPRCFPFDDADAFEVEAKPKTRGVLQYTPDFQVFRPGGHVWHETKKSWMEPGDKTRLRGLARYYPSQKLTVVVDGLPAGRTIKSRLKRRGFDFLKTLSYDLLDARPTFRSLDGWLQRANLDL